MCIYVYLCISPLRLRVFSVPNFWLPDGLGWNPRIPKHQAYNQCLSRSYPVIPDISNIFILLIRQLPNPIAPTASRSAASSSKSSSSLFGLHSAPFGMVSWDVNPPLSREKRQEERLKHWNANCVTRNSHRAKEGKEKVLSDISPRTCISKVANS